MNELKLFESPEFGKVRAIEIDGEPWFVAKDVAAALGYKNPRQAIATNVDDEDRGVHSVDTPSGVQGMTIINESGLYSLVLSSKLPSAKKFKRWVTSEVIPSIRKHGAYMTPDTLDQMIKSPEFGIRLLTELKMERDKRAEAEAQKRALEAKVEADRPKVAFSDAVAGAQNSIIIRELAKLLRQNGVDIGEKRLFEWMRKNGYLIKAKGSDYNRPTQRSMNAGWMEQRETAVSHAAGTRTHFTPLITGKGQQYFVNLFLSNKAKEA